MAYLIDYFINFFIILLFLRLFISRNETYYHPVLTIIYRFTDPIVMQARKISRSENKSIVGLILILIVFRGLLVSEVSEVGLVRCIVQSSKGLLDTLYQVYVVVFILISLGVYQYGITESIASRIFRPIYYIQNLVVSRRRNQKLALFLSLIVIYNLLNIALLSLVTLRPQDYILSSLQDSLLLIFQLVGFFTLIIIVGALLSWVSPDPYNPIVQTIYSISEPLLIPFRRIIPPLGGIDFSPIFAIIGFQLIGHLGTELVRSLFIHVNKVLF